MRYTDEHIRHVLVRLKDTPSEQLESETLEFKGYRTESALHNAKDLPEEISALANKSGGLILLGVRDSSNVPSGEWNDQLQGIEETDNKTVQERLRGKIQPVVDLRVRSINFEGKHYVAIAVPHRSDTLVSTRSGKVYIRDSRTSRPMTPIEIERAVKSLSTYDWSSEELTREWENLLDHTLIDEAIAHFSVLRHLERNPCPHSYLESIGATRNGWLTSGGLIFLGKADAIRQHLGEFEYRFSWKQSNGTLITNDFWAGSIWGAVKRARNHFGLCNVTATFEDEGRRFQVPAIDGIAFHEAYLNALVHRDYSSDGMVSVIYTGQRLIVTSPGTFYGGVTAENILRHEPRHRNKNLARMLMLHNLVDRAGMGVLRMGLSSLKYGRAFPEFREAGDSVEVSMSAEYLRPAITVLSADNPTWGIPELLIINSVYESGFVAAPTLERHLARVADDSWSSIVSAVGHMEQVELCGTNRGVYVRVAGHWKSLLRVSRAFRVSGTSAKHVKLYAYLKRHGDASNSDISRASRAQAQFADVGFPAKGRIREAHRSWSWSSVVSG